jgi:hypothetical protein
MPWLLSYKRYLALSWTLAFGCLLFFGCGKILRQDDHAIDGMIAIRDAEEKYKSRFFRFGTLEELSSSGFIVPRTQEYGYEFKLQVSGDSYMALATPIKYQDSLMSLYVDESGVIRGMLKNGQAANVKDPPLHGAGINPSLKD